MFSVLSTNQSDKSIEECKECLVITFCWSLLLLFNFSSLSVPHTVSHPSGSSHNLPVKVYSCLWWSSLVQLLTKREKECEAQGPLQPRRKKGPQCGPVTRRVTQLLGGWWLLLPDSYHCGTIMQALQRLLALGAKTRVQTKAESWHQSCSRYLLLPISPSAAGSSFKGENPLFTYTSNWFLCSRWILFAFGLSYMLSISI